MKKIVDGITFRRRPPSSSCPNGAWFSPHYHADKMGADWDIYETGVGWTDSASTIGLARKIIVGLENARRN